jgi:hypothetical protein
MTANRFSFNALQASYLADHRVVVERLFAVRVLFFFNASHLAVDDEKKIYKVLEAN